MTAFLVHIPKLSEAPGSWRGGYKLSLVSLDLMKEATMYFGMLKNAVIVLMIGSEFQQFLEL